VSFNFCDWILGVGLRLEISAGIPQVLLTPWSDCYDFANRVEMLGIGRWASKEAKPRWRRDELATCLEDVLFGPKADEIRMKAREMAMRHPESAGREKAACTVLASVSEPQ
jgi:UDP:flavonoid glycosyltransferase YjiC (YdhE family)